MSSDHRDSQLIRLQAMEDPKTNSYLTVVQSYLHLWRITYFCIVKRMGSRTLELLGEFDLGPTSLPPPDENKSTLHVANVVGGQIIQVIGEGVGSLDCATMTGNPHPAWKPPLTIVFHMQLVIVNEYYSPLITAILSILTSMKQSRQRKNLVQGSLKTKSHALIVVH